MTQDEIKRKIDRTNKIIEGLCALEGLNGVIKLSINGEYLPCYLHRIGLGLMGLDKTLKIDRDKLEVRFEEGRYITGFTLSVLGIQSIDQLREQVIDKIIEYTKQIYEL